MEPRPSASLIRVAALLVMLFLYLPLVVIVLSAFNASRIPGWPVAQYSTHWFHLAWHDQFARSAFENSI